MHDLPLSGSGKMPWLRLLMTEVLGDFWFPSCPPWPPEPPSPPGPPWLPGPPWPPSPPEPLGPCGGWVLPWWILSLCSFRRCQRGVLSSWAVFERSMSTLKKKVLKCTHLTSYKFMFSINCSLVDNNVNRSWQKQNWLNNTFHNNKPWKWRQNAS